MEYREEDLCMHVYVSLKTSFQIVLTSYSYHFPNILMLAQVIMLSITLEAGRMLGYLSILKYTLER